MSNGQVIIEGGSTGHGNGAYGNVVHGAGMGHGSGYGQHQQAAAPVFNHPTPGAYGQPAAGNGGQQPPAGNGIPQGQLLPSGAQVVSYVDRAATKLPWWFWLGLGIASYHFLINKPIWKVLKKGGG